jgi:hypothetical protein
MTIETKYNIGDKSAATVDGGPAAFVITAISIRVNSPSDVRIIYEGRLFQHATDKNGKLIKWGLERPYSFEESKLNDYQKPAPSNES